MIRIGNFEICSVVTARFRLDGGAMFGVVPKVLWSKSEDVDDLNRIALVARSLLAVDRAHGRVVLVDGGMGDKWSTTEQQRLNLCVYPDAISDALSRFGLGEDDVTDVVMTHLHFDHSGGLSVWDRPAEVSSDAPMAWPRFRHASHWIHERQWQHAHHPTERDRASFLHQDFACFEHFDRFQIVTDETSASPSDGIRWLVSDGHTPGQLLPMFHDDKQALLFAGDLVPTASHLPTARGMSYDLHPLQLIEEKRRVLEHCVSEGLGLVFPHDRLVAGGWVDVSGKRPKVLPVDLEKPD